MAGGWTRDGDMQDQIDTSVEDAVKVQGQMAEVIYSKCV